MMRLKTESGFTLMELLIVISITALIVTTIMGLFFRSLRSGAKTETIVKVEENAQYVTAVLERFIRNAKEVSSVGGLPCPNTGSSLTVLSWDGGSTTFSLSGGRIASNSSPISASVVTIQNLVFECIRTEGTPDQVAIDFDITRSDVGSGFTTATHVETKVGLRNFQ